MSYLSVFLIIILYRLIILCVPINFQRHVPSLFVILAKLQYNNFKFCLLVMMVPLLLCDVIRFLYTKPPGITFCWKTTFLYQFIFSFTSYVQYIIYPHLSQNNLNFSISIWFLNIQHFFLRLSPLLSSISGIAWPVSYF